MMFPICVSRDQFADEGQRSFPLTRRGGGTGTTRGRTGIHTRGTIRRIRIAIHSKHCTNLAGHGRSCVCRLNGTLSGGGCSRRGGRGTLARVCLRLGRGRHRNVITAGLCNAIARHYRGVIDNRTLSSGGDGNVPDC